ncbi:MAG: radical SAM family heme chaperone HemW [Dorea sp.]|nr:radical SAM family heme chaperone HemW [Dorea sp.]
MKPLEIYVHIPFCVKKCNYCDFLSAPSTGAQRQKYVESLCGHIRSCGETAKAYRVVSIFIGGGTPSILEGEQIAAIFKAVRDTFYIEESAEITIEMNPGTVTADKLRAYRSFGINRLSIGLQSADDKELRILGRLHTFEDFLKTYRMARGEGFRNINIDLISAVPGQTIESFKRTLLRTVSLSPEHISAYSLIIEEGTPFFEIYGEGAHKEKICDAHGHPQLPDEDSERQMYYDTKRILKEYGYHRYEISNYAKDGYECRHNLGYWNRTEYLGFGDGAASLFDHKRWVTGEKPKMLNREEEMEEYMFLGLRMINGVSKLRFKKEFGITMESIYKQVLADMESKRLLEQDGDFVRLTERGLDVSNYVMSEFLL